MTDSSPVPGIGDLLAEEDFVRRLARGLLFDTHRVDDVVQQTWLAALTHPPQERAASRSWLERVVKNLALNQIRGESRRRRREAEVAQVEEAPSVEEVLEREALRKQAVQAMLALSEPYRSTVVLRYFEDQTPKQISRRTGVPAGTVRARLKRGLDLMREHLDRTCGDRKRWATGLIPLVRAERVAPAAGVLPLLALAGSLFVVAAGLWALWPSDPTPPQATRVVDSATSEDPADVASSTAPSDPDLGNQVRQAIAVEPSPLAQSGFRGRLVTPSGIPAIGELVRIFGVNGLTVFIEGRGNRVIGSEAKTGVDGRFLVEGLEPGALYLMHAGAGGAHASLHTVGHTPGPGEIVDLGDIPLQARGGIEGRVVDAEGEPVSGAEVWAADLPAVILAAVPLDRLSPDNGAILWLPVPSAAELSGETDFAARLEKFLGADMLQKSGLENREDTAALVVDAPAWVHRLYDWLPVSRTRTAADGSFRLAGAPPGSNVLVARHPGLLTGQRQVMVRVERTRDIGTLRLRDGETAYGSVTDARGRPIANAEVRVAAVGSFGLRGLAFCEPAVRTDSAGRFEVRGLPRGEMLVAVRDDAARPWTVRGPVSVDEELDIALPGAESLTVELEDGGALTDVELTLFDGPSLGELRHAGLQRSLPLGQRLRRLAAGRYRIDDLRRGAYSLRIEASGHAPEEVMFRIPRSAALRVRLRPTAPVVVRVQDPHGLAVAGARIFAQPESPPGWARRILPTSYGLPSWSALPIDAGVTDEDGSLRVDVLPEGPVRMGAFHPGLGQVDEQFTLPASEILLVMPGAGRIRGQLYDRGRPAEPGKWRLSVTYEDRGSAGSMPRSPGYAAIGLDGRFHIEGLSAGTYVVKPEPTDDVTSLAGLVDLVQEKVSPFQFDFGPRPTYKQVEVRAGEMAELRFDLDPSWAEPGTGGGSITGVVKLDGEPASGLQIRRDDSISHSVFTTTDSGGAFRVDGLAPGRLTVSVQDRQQQAPLWERRVNVEIDKELQLDVVIWTGSLEGNAWRGDGGGVSGLRVRARDFETVTDRSGGFRFEGLPTGTYEVVVEGAGLRGRSEEFSLTTGLNPAVSVEILHLVAVEGRVERDETVQMVQLTSEQLGVWEYSLVAADGSFRIEGLEPGVYRVMLVASGTEEAVPKEITVPVSGLRGLEIR